MKFTVETLKKIGRNDNPPEFRERWNFTNKNLRTYLHTSGYDTAYEKNSANARAHLQATFENLEDLLMPLDHTPRVQDCSYILSFVWGQGEDKMIDWLLVHDIDESYHTDTKMWRNANPEINIITTENGLVYPDQSRICGDVSIVSGREEEYRRTTDHLDNYLKFPMDLDDIGLKCTHVEMLEIPSFN
jgi:hypothetical protein|tara:strand:- start:56 stop:619 length:564 start_codon:yes stop_codon:yes gene_type:complete